MRGAVPAGSGHAVPMSDSRPSQADSPMVDAAQDDADVHALSAQAQADSAGPDEGDDEPDVPSAPADPDETAADLDGPLNPA